MARYASGIKSKGIIDISDAVIREDSTDQTIKNNTIFNITRIYNPKHPKATPAKNVVDATALFNPRPDNDPENVRFYLVLHKILQLLIKKSNILFGIPAFGRIGGFVPSVVQSSEPNATGQKISTIE